MSRSKNLSEEDRVLWSLVARTATPLEGRAPPILPEAPSQPAPEAPSAAPYVAAAKPKTSSVSHVLDRPTLDKLAKGRMPIEARVDLHGMTQGEAHAALGRFIRAAVRAERRTLLVITGKGRLGGGVLRRSLPLWLEDSALGGDVLAITPAAPKDGGDGAFYIRLRKPKPRG